MPASDKAKELTMLAHQILKTAQGAELPQLACNVAVIVFAPGPDGYALGVSSTSSLEDLHHLVQALANKLAGAEEMPIPIVGEA